VEKRSNKIGGVINNKIITVNREIKIMKKNQILELKKEMNKIKNATENMSSRINHSEERICEAKDR
jgi:hypothetical protein